MPRSVSFDQATLALMDAALDPTQWVRAMDGVAHYANASGAVLLQIRGRTPGTPHSECLSEGLDTYFRDGWHLRDERERGVPHMRTKGVFVDQDFASPDEVKSLDYYHFLRKYGMGWSAGIGFSNQDDEWCMVIQRGEGGGFFDANEQADLVRFGAHLDRAAQLSRQLAYANATGMVDAFEMLGCASFLLDRGGLVIRHNAQAEALIGDGLTMSGRKLNCDHPGSNLALGQLIAALNPVSMLTPADPPTAVMASRPAKRPLVIQGIVLAGTASTIFSPAASILLVSDTDKRPPPTAVARTRSMFGLTAKEAMLLSLLEMETPLSAAADMMGISFETARSHLKRIFAKTGASRQADLLMLLSRIRRIGP